MYCYCPIFGFVYSHQSRLPISLYFYYYSSASFLDVSIQSTHLRTLQLPYFFSYILPLLPPLRIFLSLVLYILITSFGINFLFLLYSCIPLPFAALTHSLAHFIFYASASKTDCCWCLFTEYLNIGIMHK